MAINIVCGSCHKRFKVSDKFAGRKGPCPNCKEPIYVPKPGEEVQIHTPEHSEAGTRGASGQHLLKPLEREDVVLPNWAIWTIVGVMAGAFFIAFVLRLVDSDMVHTIAAIIGAVGLAPPLVLAAYRFLRNDELAPYSGKALWIRTGACAAVYAGCWGVYCLLPPDMTKETYQWMFIGPAFGVVGSLAAYVCLDLDFGSGFFHYCLYMGITMLLAITMGLPVFGA